MSEELKPCPFCGNDAKVCEGGGTFYVVCTGLGKRNKRYPSIRCWAAMGEGYDASAMPDHRFTSEYDASEAWNRREKESK